VWGRGGGGGIAGYALCICLEPPRRFRDSKHVHGSQPGRGLAGQVQEPHGPGVIAALARCCPSADGQCWRIAVGDVPPTRPDSTCELRLRGETPVHRRRPGCLIGHGAGREHPLGDSAGSVEIATTRPKGTTGGQGPGAGNGPEAGRQRAFIHIQAANRPGPSAGAVGISERCVDPRCRCRWCNQR